MASTFGTTTGTGPGSTGSSTTESSPLEEVSRELESVWRQHGLGMELDAVDRQFAVTYGHDLTVGCYGRDLELIRDAGRGQRVITTDLEALWQAGEQALAVVLDRARLAVYQLARGTHLAAEDFHDRLVSEADAERGRRRCETAHDLLGSAGRG